MKTTAEKIAVMQAFEDGKTIVIKDRPYSSFTKGSIPNPWWNWENHDYDVKKEPRTFYINEYPDDGVLYLHRTEADARLGRSDGKGGHPGKTFKVVEVLED